MVKYGLVILLFHANLYQVVRLCAKSREAVSSPVEHLTLHYQVRQQCSLLFNHKVFLVQLRHGR